MKISIITVCYNSIKTIEDTIISVLSQKVGSLEYIIIDGGSTDGTMDIISKYKEKINKVISEPDSGIYDAMNKGILLSTGDVIGILNSDDFYYDNNILKNVVNIFEKNNVDACYGNIRYVSREDSQKSFRYWQTGLYRKEKLSSGWIIPHPAFFVKKKIYDKYGVFNLDFKIASDYELILRFLQKNIMVEYLNKTFVCMREGGFSASSFKQRRSGWSELKMAWKINGLDVPVFFIIRRILSKIKQYFV